MIGTTSPALLLACAWPLLAAAMLLCACAALGLRAAPLDDLPQASRAKAFQLGHALVIALVIAAVLLLSEGLRQLFGQAGALAAATIAALAELQAGAVSIASLVVSIGYFACGLLQQARVLHVDAGTAMILVFPMLCLVYGLAKMALVKRYL